MGIVQVMRAQGRCIWFWFEPAAPALSNKEKKSGIDECRWVCRQPNSVLVLVVNVQLKLTRYCLRLALPRHLDRNVRWNGPRQRSPAEDAKQIEAQLAEHDLVMLDAPVSGGAVKAVVGEMTARVRRSKHYLRNSGSCTRCNQPKSTTLAKRLDLATVIILPVTCWCSPFSSCGRGKRWH